jgi:predicted nuclease of predicted toxin-antitoxin system
MLLVGKNVSKKQQQHKQVTFFLDESLPYQLAYFLKTVDYPITSWHEEFQGQQGKKDPWLIPYLGAKKYVWITKDDEAKKEHESEIRAAGISVVWVRGLGRPGAKPKKNVIRVRDVLRMLTDKLYVIEQRIANAKGPLYFMLYVKSGGQPVVRRVTLEEVFRGLCRKTRK